MADPKPNFKRTLLAVVGVTILTRFYYAWIMRDGPAWQVWFAMNPVLAMATLVPIATLSAWVIGGAVGRSMGQRLILPSAIAAGTAATAMVNGLVGAGVGTFVGALMVSSTLRALSKHLIRLQFRLSIVLAICAAAGWLANEFAAGNGLTRTMPSIVCLTLSVFVAMVVAWWLARGDKMKLDKLDAGPQGDSSRTTLGRLNRVALPMIGTMFSLTFAWLGVRGGVEAHRYWQAVCLRQRGDVSLYASSQPNLALLTGQRNLVAPLGITLYSDATDDDLLRLRFFRELESLEVYGGKQSAVGYARLGSLPALRYVWLEDTDIDDDGLAKLLSVAKPNVVSLIKTNVTNRSIPLMASWPLVTLRLDGVERKVDAGYSSFAACKKIEWIQLDHVGLTDAEVTRLATLPALRHCSLVGNDIRGEGLTALGQGRWLRSIDLSDNPLDDRYLRSLLPLKLKWLDINNVCVTPFGWYAISQMTLLDHLSLKGTNIDSHHLVGIVPKFIELREIELEASSLADHAICLPVKSVTLHVADRTLTAADISRLAALALTAEREQSTDVRITLRNCVLPTDAVAELRQQPVRLFAADGCQYDARFDAMIQDHLLVYVN